MEVKKCFMPGCKTEAEYLCQCTSPGTYSCESHISKHINQLNKVHAFESIFVESCKETKEKILKVLAEKISKYSNLKKTLIASFSLNLLNSENNFKELMKVLDKSSDKLIYLTSKIKETEKILKAEQDPILRLLSMQPEEAVKKAKTIIPVRPCWFENAEDELKSLSSQNNPYIISLDSYFQLEKKALKNYSLLQLIVDKQIKNQFFDEKEIWKYFIQISFAIEALHSNGNIHKYIKPENILLDGNKDIKLADLMLSRYLQASITEAASPYYSPRMCNGDFPTKESDVWGLGCILYYLCNLEYPFKGNKQKIQNKMHAPIKSQYSQELKYFVDWCLKKKQNERPTINEIITHGFIVNKALSLGINIPKASAMSTIYRETLNNDKTKILELESKLSEFSNEPINQMAEIEQLRSEITRLNNIIVEKDNYIEIFSLKVEDLANFLENFKNTLNENQLIGVKNYLRDLIADTDKIKKMFYYSEQDSKCNKAQEIHQSKNVTNIISLQNLRDKRSEILKSPSNNLKIEEDFRRISSAYKSDLCTYDTATMQAYQDYINTYLRTTSLFNLKYEHQETYLLIYNTNTEMQEEPKVLKTSQPLYTGTCITQLPNGKLFCFGNYDRITALIDESFQIELLPSGKACFYSSAIYFDNNVYCFGGKDSDLLPLSKRFDLNRNQWIKLTPMPEADAFCNSIIFNGNILIAGFENKNILRYSISKNYFIAIPYDFARKRRKILINAERLYLIECENGSIYESEIGSDTAWRLIANQSIIDFHPQQVYCEYNKGGIYIGCAKDGLMCARFKFNLSEKSLTKLN